MGRKEQLITEYNNDIRLKKARRNAYIEGGFWVAYAVLTAVIGAWYLVPIVLIIVLKIHENYLHRKIYLMQDNLLTSVFENLRDVTDEIVDKEVSRLKKEKKHGSTNARTNRKKQSK